MGVNSEPRRLCLVGATGLVGSTLIEQGVNRRDVRLIGVTRREVKLPRGARMEMLLADPAGWDDAIAAANASVLVCALGTTWRKAGKDEAAFRAVDHDLVLSCARAARKAGIDHMIVVSSAGAGPASTNIYLRVKGQVDQALARLRFRRLDVLRPGVIRGRRDERDRRPAERLAMLASPVTDLFLRGKYRKYRSIDVGDLGRAIFALAGQRAGGHFIHEHDSLFRAIRRDSGYPHHAALRQLTASCSPAIFNPSLTARESPGDSQQSGSTGAEGATAPESLRPTDRVSR